MQSLDILRTCIFHCGHSLANRYFCDAIKVFVHVKIAANLQSDWQGWMARGLNLLLKKKKRKEENRDRNIQTVLNIQRVQYSQSVGFVPFLPVCPVAPGIVWLMFIIFFLSGYGIARAKEETREGKARQGKLSVIVLLANKYCFYHLPVYWHFSLKRFSSSTRNGVSALIKASKCSFEPVLHNTA